MTKRSRSLADSAVVFATSESASYLLVPLYALRSITTNIDPHFNFHKKKTPPATPPSHAQQRRRRIHNLLLARHPRPWRVHPPRLRGCRRALHLQRRRQRPQKRHP